MQSDALLQGASAWTQTRVAFVPTGMQPYPFGQSAPVWHGTVQYPVAGGVRQPKLQSVAAPHWRPVSSPAQNMPWPFADTQTVPVMHPPVELHVRVQRWVSPGNIGRQTSGDAQSPSDVHGSSSCSFIDPPLVLVVLALVLLVLALVLALVLLALALVLALVLAPPVLALVLAPPVLALVLAPPVLELVFVPAPPVPAPEPPLPGGTHCAF